jgi:ATP-dependent protease ClpP protease subunit
MVTGTLNIPRGTQLVYVSFSAEINIKTTESLIAVMSNLVNLNVQQVYLVLNTPGGFVANGLNLYNVLRGMPFNLVTHNAGNIDSIGNVVFLAGRTRYATANATFMFHGVGFDITSNQRLEEKNLRELLGGVISHHRQIGTIIAQHTNLKAREIARLFREAQTKDASWAINKGIIQDIRDIQIPTGCPVISLVFQR